MKIIQSFWSGNQKDFSNNYGWNSYKYNWMSWILSCHQLVRFYDRVELYTDDFGYDILIKKLKLPYTKVHVVLNELDVYPKDLWAIAKIVTYSLQDEPFIHVDGDVFIWEKFPKSLTNGQLFSQNLENTTDYYRSMWNSISPKLQFIPNELMQFHNEITNLSSNMGIVGGNDISFFKKYSSKSLEFVNKNYSAWFDINLFNFNIFFEQELFHELATAESTEIKYLFDEIWGDNAYVGFGDFNKVPHKRTYLHLLGVFKRRLSVCREMEVYIMKYYPENYSILAKMINEFNGNDVDIEYLTKGLIKEFLLEYSTNLRQNQFNFDNFILKRDLYNEGMTNFLDECLDNKIEFKITLLPTFIKSTTIIDDETVDLLEVEELNSEATIYYLDIVDEIIFMELEKPVEYSQFINKMENHFEDDSKDEFLNLINNRLHNYLILKIISIHGNSLFQDEEFHIEELHSATKV